MFVIDENANVVEDVISMLSGLVVGPSFYLFIFFFLSLSLSISPSFSLSLVCIDCA